MNRLVLHFLKDNSGATAIEGRLALGSERATDAPQCSR